MELQAHIKESMRAAPVRYLTELEAYHLLNCPMNQCGYLYRMFNTKEKWTMKKLTKEWTVKKRKLTTTSKIDLFLVLAFASIGAVAWFTAMAFGLLGAN